MKIIPVGVPVGDNSFGGINNTMEVLFHDQGYKYLSPLEPRCEDCVTLRLQSSENLNAAYVLYKLKNSDKIEQIKMRFEKPDCIKGYYLYKALIEPKDQPYRYCFRAEKSDGSIIYYNVYGESEKMDLDSGFYLIPGFSTPNWSKGAFWYSILPNAYFNGNVLNDKTGETEPVPFGGGACHPYNSRYGGDIEGIIEKLPYIKDIGVDAIFINPIWQCKDAGGYGPDNFDMLDPAYCNDKELCRFIEETHNYGLKIMLDAVVVFATRSNYLYNIYDEWPIKGAASDKNSDFCNYFFFKKWPDEYQNYFSSIDFDYSKNCVKDYIYRNDNSHIQRYLSEPYGIDAWRFDSASLLWGQNMSPHDVSKEIKPYVKKYGEDKLFLSECFCNTDEGVWEACWNMHHLFNLREWMLKKYDIKFFLWKMRMSLNMRCRPFALSMYTHFDNHDVKRLYPQVKEKERLLAGIICQMTYLGSPTLYYGDETGDKNMNIGYYHNFNWNTSDWDTDYYKLYKVLSAIRKENNILKTGIVRVGLLDNDRELLSYGRFNENGAVVTVINPNKRIKRLEIPVDIYEVSDGTVLTDIISGKSTVVKNGVVVSDVEPGGAVFAADLRKDFSCYDSIELSPILNTEGIIAPERDYTITCFIGDDFSFCEIFIGKSKENCVYIQCDATVEDNHLYFGRVVSGKKLPFFEISAPKGTLEIHVQRVGTRYTTLYKVDNSVWKLIGENLFASFSNEFVFFECDGDDSRFDFGDKLYGGERQNAPIGVGGFDGEFSLIDNSQILRYIPIDSHENYKYINGGIEFEGNLPFGALVLSKALANFRINASLLPLGKGKCGIIFGADSKLVGGYRLSLENDGEYCLTHKSRLLTKGKTEISPFGVDFIIEAFNNRIALYLSGVPIFFSSLDSTSGKIGFFRENTPCRLLNYMVCDLSVGITKQNIFWRFEKNTAYAEGTGLISPKGRAYSSFRAETTVKITKNDENVGYAGILAAASESFLPNYDGLFFAVSSDGRFVVLNQDNFVYEIKLYEDLDKHTIFVECLDGVYTCSVDRLQTFTFESRENFGGAVSACSISSKCEFSSFTIDSLDLK